MNVEGPAPGWDANLPPLPSPLRAERARQARYGVAAVLTAVAVLLSAGLALLLSAPLPVAAWAPILSVWLLVALFALVCLHQLLFSDCGSIIRRSKETCLPIPVALAAQLAEGCAWPPADNLTDASTGRTYCVRCFVWRPPPAPPEERGRVCKLVLPSARVQHQVL